MRNIVNLHYKHIQQQPTAINATLGVLLALRHPSHNLQEELCMLVVRGPVHA